MVSIYNCSMANTKVSENTDKVTSVVAKEADGNIQITFTVPYALIQKAQEETVAEMAKDMTVPGFRKGNAPLNKVREKISQGTLIEHSLGHILPKALAETINENKLKLAVYPHYDLLRAEDGQDWQIRAVTCELPEIDLGDYKEKIKGANRAGSLWVPGKDEAKKEPTREDKEQVVMKALLENIKLTVPKVLIESEVNSRLSNLLSRIEKLGLALENYLASIGKTPDSIRAEYEAQSKDAISLDLILSKIAETENIKADEKEIEGALNISKATIPNKDEGAEDPEQRKRLLESILRRRKALDFLISLA